MVFIVLSANWESEWVNQIGMIEWICEGMNGKMRMNGIAICVANSMRAHAPIVNVWLLKVECRTVRLVEV